MRQSHATTLTLENPIPSKMCFLVFSSHLTLLERDLAMLFLSVRPSVCPSVYQTRAS